MKWNDTFQRPVILVTDDEKWHKIKRHDQFLPALKRASLGLTNPRTLCGKVTVLPGVYSCVDPVLLLPGWGRTLSVRPTCASRPPYPALPRALALSTKHGLGARGHRSSGLNAHCTLGSASSRHHRLLPFQAGSPRALTPAGQQVISKYPPPAGLHDSVLGVPQRTMLPSQFSGTSTRRGGDFIITGNITTESGKQVRKSTSTASATGLSPP